MPVLCAESVSRIASSLRAAPPVPRTTRGGTLDPTNGAERHTDVPLESCSLPFTNQGGRPIGRQPTVMPATPRTRSAATAQEAAARAREAAAPTARPNAMSSAPGRERLNTIAVYWHPPGWVTTPTPSRTDPTGPAHSAATQTGGRRPTTTRCRSVGTPSPSRGQQWSGAIGPDRLHRFGRAAGGGAGGPARAEHPTGGHVLVQRPALRQRQSRTRPARRPTRRGLPALPLRRTSAPVSRPLGDMEGTPGCCSSCRPRGSR